LAASRKKAVDAQTMAFNGEDPRANRLDHRRRIQEESKRNFGFLRDEFLRLYCEPNLKPATLRQYRSLFVTKELEDWERLPLSQIRRRDVIDLLDRVVVEGTPTKANRVLDLLRSMFNWAVVRDIIEHSPTDKVQNPAPEVERDRVLSIDEIKVFWEACGSTNCFESIYKILLLTGQRRSEVGEMRWSELISLKKGEGLWVIPKERTKMSRAHKVPLSDAVIEILDQVPRTSEEFVFSTTGRTPVTGYTRAKQRIDERIKEIIEEKDLSDLFTEPWRVHDLRRTAATHMAEMGVSRDVVELILNHRSGTRRGVAGVYNRSELLSERRTALERLARLVPCIDR
jgi:integrase